MNACRARIFALVLLPALTLAGKDYELVIVPGTGHGAAETPFGFRKRMNFLERELLNVEGEVGR